MTFELCCVNGGVDHGISADDNGIGEDCAVDGCVHGGAECGRDTNIASGDVCGTAGRDFGSSDEHQWIEPVQGVCAAGQCISVCWSDRNSCCVELRGCLLLFSFFLISVYTTFLVLYLCFGVDEIAIDV